MDLRAQLRRVPGARALRDRLPVVMTRRGRERLVKQAGGDYPPGSFFSPIPSPTDIARAEPHLTDLAGIDLRIDEQWVLLEALAAHPYHRDARNRDASDEAADEAAPGTDRPARRYDLDNVVYGWADGASLYSLIHHLKPDRIVEVRSGTSTACMLDAIEDAGLDTTLTCIRPHPSLESIMRPADRARVTVVEADVQDAGTDLYTSLQPNDMVFIHSPHVVKAGSDVQFLLFEVLPRLAPGVWVHFHDILPGFEYPRHWLERGWFWSEAYILRAFLQDNDRYRINLWPSLLERLDPDRTHRLLWPSQHDPGSALWLQRT